MTVQTDLHGTAGSHGGPYRSRVTLLTGATSWTLHALPERMLRPIVVSDGPIGVRGVDEDTRPSAQLPSPTALAATWDPALIARLGTLIAGEARRKRVDVVLSPVVNLQRTPYGGRHFEAFSEDPLLTGTIAAEFIRAVQERGVAVCVKHFLGNESETERTSYLAKIGERALREVYLAPFEKAVREAGVWSVMAAYNGIDDGYEASPATEHSRLLNDVLKGEWGFDGVVISDWLATSSTVESALGGLDLVMPGPGGPWAEGLEKAVEEGLVPESLLDDKVDRIVRLGARVGAVPGTPVTVDAVQRNLPVMQSTRELLRETVARSMVVLGNNGLLPLPVSTVGTVALIGPNALDPFVQGGGSAFVTAPYLASAQQALQDVLPYAVVKADRGTSAYAHARPIDPSLVTTPDGEPGYSLTFVDEHDVPVGEERIVPASESWNREAPLGAIRARIRAVVTLDQPGDHRIGVGVSGAHTIRFDGEVASTSTTWADHDVILDSSANHPNGPAAVLSSDGGRRVTIESNQQVVDAGAYGRFVRFLLRHDLPGLPPDEEIERAVAVAAAADTAIVVVGTNEETESEGWDRRDLQLPGRQNELVERVIAANPRTVVVVNAGAPVILPWLESAAAVLWWWLPGQEAGNGLADALLGVTEPSGRLPWTLPAAEADVPVKETTPVDGVLDYTEGIDIGYRGWERLDRTPAREFGFGLGYGTWQYDGIELHGGPDDLVVQVALTNTGSRQAREVVQVYLEAPDSPVERPVRWLAGFAAAELAAGESATLRVPVGRRALETWNVAQHRWEIPEGRYVFRAGRSSRDLRLSATASLKDAG
ncbi:glycoside hydrolase family 3 C-terminal domain-containing protein [Kribbella sp. NPDC051770]|uniref:beta-glucosidase family protein n=1 Tax=Kribbella sp. NPDC051770 TaxID=3155413 RepID=UPI0034487EDF